MSMISFSIKGGSELGQLMARINKMTVDHLDAALLLGAEDVKREAILAISKGQRTGKRYRANRGGAFHIASAPGEAPKTRSGWLVQNITTKRISKLSIDVGSRERAGYGKFLEFGTSKMAARPWLRPSLERALPSIKDRVFEAVKKGTKPSG